MGYHHLKTLWCSAAEEEVTIHRRAQAHACMYCMYCMYCMSQRNYFNKGHKVVIKWTMKRLLLLRDLGQNYLIFITKGMKFIRYVTGWVLESECQVWYVQFGGGLTIKYNMWRARNERWISLFFVSQGDKTIFPQEFYVHEFLSFWVSESLSGPEKSEISSSTSFFSLSLWFWNSM